MSEKYDWKSSPTNSIDESSDDRMEAGGAKLPITYDDLPIEEIETSSWWLHRRCSRGIGMALFVILAIVLVGLGVGFSFYDKSEPISALNSTLEVAPSYAPTSPQTSLPSAPSSSPTASPTASASPSISPSSMPSISPSDGPSSEPSSGPTGEPTALPSSEPTKDPTREPTDDPTSEPTMDPTRKPTDEPAEDPDAATVVLKPGHKLERGDYVSSPSGHYRVGLSSDGNFKLKDTFDDDKVIWDADISSGYKAYMQEDGNFIIRDRNGKNLWSTETADYKNAKLTVDNSGTVGVVYKDSYVWMQGVPQGSYEGSYEGPNKDIKFPIRGTFYYSWYPETWEVSSGAKARFKPDKFGYYNSADPKVIEAHLDEFDYGNIELGIISWWGQSTNNDRARISLLQKMTLDLHYDIKWCVYYEEMGKKKSEDDVREDLAYLKKWFAWHPTWPHVDGKPVIFVYHNSGCSNVKRWMKASDGEWHVVLKIFGGYKDCSAQPDSWHQYAPAKDVVEKKGEYFVISPGFWHAGRSKPSLPRLSKSKFCDNVQDMVDSREPWQLVATFNEGGEGTLIEPSKKWESDSGYGYYLDCLHKIK